MDDVQLIHCAECENTIVWVTGSRLLHRPDGAHHLVEPGDLEIGGTP